MIRNLVLGASVVALLSVAYGPPAHSAEVTLRGASCWPIGAPPGRPFEAVVKEVNARGKGTLQIDLIGGAPAIGSPFTLTQKMSKGAYDVVGCTEAYFGNVLPEAPVLRFSEYTYGELRKNGGLDYVSKLLAEKNIHYVARHHDFGPFHLWLKDPIDKPDLTGLNLRVAPVYTAFFKTLGATVQTSTIQQVYTYMENGTVQGYGWPAAGWVPTWTEVTGYKVDPGFYNATIHTLINLDKWKSLSKDQQELLNTIGLEFESRVEPGSPGLQAQLKKENDFRAGKGMKVIAFSGADRQKWVDTARQAGWAEVLERSPEHGAALQKLFTK
jgi:TRAP-type C4-dicarboxylate transport system substrate-binding protein